MQMQTSIMGEQEITKETGEGVFENVDDIDWSALGDINSIDLVDLPELSQSSVNLSSTSVTHPQEECAPRMGLAGQSVPGQPHCIAAADNEMLSSSHQGRYTTQPLCTESQFCQKDFEDQHRDLGDKSASSYSGTFSDSADWLSSMLITNQEEHCDQPIQMVGQFEQTVPEQLHCIAAAHKGQPSSSNQGRYIAAQPGCIESPFGQGGEILNPTTTVSGQHVRNLKTDDQGYIVTGKTTWQTELKRYMYEILDFGIVEIKNQPRANLEKLYAKMNEGFTYSPSPLKEGEMYGYIERQLRQIRHAWKKQWMEDKRMPPPPECPEAAWESLIEHWLSEKAMAETERMKKARGAVKNPSHVGRGGRKKML